MNRHIVCPFEVTGQLQVSMQTVRPSFSKKIHLYVGITVRGICPIQNTPGPAGITFRKGTVAGIRMYVPA
jgi:hypothetical protein